eukprot:scaffold331_cov47-Cyclotella_meneghiniana.AAC.1
MSSHVMSTASFVPLGNIGIVNSFTAKDHVNATKRPSLFPPPIPPQRCNFTTYKPACRYWTVARKRQRRQYGHI